MISLLKSQLCRDIQKNIDTFKTLTSSHFERPKVLDHGDLALPVFVFAKQHQKNPIDFAKSVAMHIQSLSLTYLERVDAIQGFVNFRFQAEYLQQILFTAIQKSKDNDLGHQNVGQGQIVTIDFSSPNVAKPMSIGHLRATVIGQAIYNLAKTQGYSVIGINHLGDWGVQFGKLAWAFQNWANEYSFDEHPFQSLYALYVRFHEAAEDDPMLNNEGSKIFRRLEQGDPAITALWQKFIDISLSEYARQFQLLGVHHDLVLGESFYNDRLRAVEHELIQKGLLVESEGAMVVRLDDYGMPPCLIRKSDGASIYATRDIAAAIYRHDELKADINLYVVGVDQSLHFKQVFKVLELMGYEWAKDCHHIAFGLYKFKDLGKMSTRKGNVIFFEDVVQRSIQMVREVIDNKNPSLPNKNKVAEEVGAGAIIFNDLVNDRIKNVDFDWGRVVDFEGDSGPFVQYTLVRCLSLMRKYEPPISYGSHAILHAPEERALMLELLSLEHILKLAFEHFRPHIVAGYALDVARAFGRFYHADRILGMDREIESARMALVQATALVLKKSLSVLNIQTPEAM